MHGKTRSRQASPMCIPSAERASSSPLIFVRAEASTPEIAVGTTEFVAERIQQELRQQQQAVGVADEDLIEALDVIPVVEAGAQVQNQRRLQVLALGFGVVVAVLSAAGVEGWARRRETSHATSVAVKLEDRDAIQRGWLGLLQERKRLLIAQQRLLDEQIAGSMVISRPDRDSDTPPEEPVTEPTSDGGRKRTEDRSGELRGGTVGPPDRMDRNNLTRTGWPAAPHVSGRLLET